MVRVPHRGDSAETQGMDAEVGHVGKHILIVEDQGALSDALARRFSRRGFKVTECSDPDTALDSLRNVAVDLVICDINLNDQMSGIDIFNTVRGEGIKTPFIFFTGHGEGTEEIQKAQAGGAEAVFSKPTDFSVLLDKVCVILGLSSDAISLATPK